MQNTTYYNLNIVEGTDIVNPLTVDNPNYEKIDEVMHNNAVSGVTLATEIANATVHALTRVNSECAVIRFIATSAWKAGDTVTVDGVPVTALLPSGETLPNGAYVINSNVLCILTGTYLTVYAERKKTDNANEIAYNSTTVSAELDTIEKEISWELLSSGTSEFQVYRCLEYNLVIYPNNNAYAAVSLCIPHVALVSGTMANSNYFNVSYFSKNIQLQLVPDGDIVTIKKITDVEENAGTTIYAYGKGRYNK